jgi:hypothetical protein
MSENANKKWTEDEEEQLVDRLGSANIPRISKGLGRSTESVIRKLERLGCYDKAAETGSFRTYEFANILSIDPTTIIRWIKKEGMPAKQFYRKGKLDKQNHYYYIFSDDFWKWANNNPDLINFKKIHRGILIPEPEWLEDAIKNEKKLIKNQSYWTTGEDKIVWDLFYQKGMTQDQIGDHVGRTRRAVQKRLATIRKQRNPS